MKASRVVAKQSQQIEEVLETLKEMATDISSLKRDVASMKATLQLLSTVVAEGKAKGTNAKDKETDRLA